MTTDQLSIGALSRQTNVPVETLRAWERRYGVPTPQRSDGRHRRYGPDDLERVRWLARRVADGERIGQAVAALNLVEGAGGEAHRQLLNAARDGDVGRIERELDRAFEALEILPALELCVFPALAELGRRWADGAEAIAAEHLLTAAVEPRLATLLSAGRRRTGPEAVVFCGPGERHALGAMALAVLIGDHGWRVTFLGADLPPDEAAQLARRIGAGLAIAVCTLDAPAAALIASHPPTGGVTWVATGPGVATNPESPRGWRVLQGDLRRVADFIGRLAPE
ncbi:MAG: MerR family transcriptional regulator [Thermoleophilia bacterium]